MRRSIPKSSINYWSCSKTRGSSWATTGLAAKLEAAGVAVTAEPQTITVHVSNSTGQDGLGASAASELRQHGFSAR